jgi:hypothetical protein
MPGSPMPANGPYMAPAIPRRGHLRAATYQTDISCAPSCCPRRLHLLGRQQSHSHREREPALALAIRAIHRRLCGRDCFRGWLLQKVVPSGGFNSALLGFG